MASQAGSTMSERCCTHQLENHQDHDARHSFSRGNAKSCLQTTCPGWFPPGHPRRLKTPMWLWKPKTQLIKCPLF